MAYNIVTNSVVISEIKKCRYFKINLGLSTTLIDKGGHRVANENDQFSLYYGNQYKTIIYAQGNIGDMKFYTDHFIKDPIMAVYSGPNFEEFVFTIDFKLLAEKGIDFYLGHILKEVESQYEERVKTETEKKLEPKKQGDADMILKNPGSVTYSDLKAYLDAQNKNRYSTNGNQS